MLSVIGAGFGRTGTESMKRALELLGLGRCHHMYEVLGDEEHRAVWREVPDDPAPDWDAIYDGYGCAVDWPTAYYWRELAAHWPEAKVLLTLRSAQSWWQSFSQTILPILIRTRDGDEPVSMGYRLIAERTFGGRIEDRDHCMAVFEANTTSARAEIPPDRLIVYELGSGWGPLCTALDLPVPDVEYPRGNSRDEFHSRLENNSAGRA